MPVMNQGRLVALLYAENNAATHAFTPQRLSLLQVIASQAAISITNARLTTAWRRRSPNGRASWRDKNREVAAMLNSMQQGVFTIDQNLVIQPQYSATWRAPGPARPGRRRLLRGPVCGGRPLRLTVLRRRGRRWQCDFGRASFIAEATPRHLVREVRRQAPGTGPGIWRLTGAGFVDDNDSVEKVLVTVCGTSPS